MTDEQAYAKLQTYLTADLILRGQEENESAKAVYQHVLTAIWPAVEEIMEEKFTDGQNNIWESLE